MKIFILILILLIISHLSFSLIFSSETVSAFDQEQIDQEIPDPGKEGEEIVPEDDDVIFDQASFSKDEKKLPPLSRQEKIIWSFRLSRSYPFL